MNIKRISHLAIVSAMLASASLANTGCDHIDVNSLGTLAGYGAGITDTIDPMVSMAIAPLIGYAAERIQVTSIKKSDTSNGYSVMANVDGQEYECHLANLTSTSQTDTCQPIPKVDAKK